MSIVKSEFALALNQIATERGISVDDVVESIKTAVIAAYNKEYQLHNEEGESGIEVKIDHNSGEIKVVKDGKNITPPGFGRIAAQTAKQVIMSKVREVERRKIVSQYRDQVGGLVKGRIIKNDNYVAYVDIGKAEAVLPKSEQVKSENYSVNASFIFYLKEISEDHNGYSRIIVSRSSPNLIKELFRREVPEIANGAVEIKGVVREPKERAKIAVFSKQSGVDPVGACVGQKGVRVQTVTDELGGTEKIDIIQWHEDPNVFIEAALSPAQVNTIEIDEEKKRAKVMVSEEQAPLAIGKGGVNVNLASKLTGYEIDIVQINL